MRKCVALLVGLVLLTVAGEARSQSDALVVGNFPNGAQLIVKVHFSGGLNLVGAGTVFTPGGGRQRVRITGGASLPSGGFLLVGNTRTPNQPIAILVDANNNLTFLYFGQIFTGTINPLTLV